MDSEINTSKSSKTILSMTGRSEFLRNNFNYFVFFFCRADFFRWIKILDLVTLYDEHYGWMT